MTDAEKQELVAVVASAVAVPAGSVLLVKVPTPERLHAIIGVLSLVRMRTGCEFLVSTSEFVVEQLGVAAAPMEVAAAMQQLLSAGSDVGEVARRLCDQFMVMTREPRFVLEGDATVC